MKLTMQQAEDIRTRSAAGVSYTTLSIEYKVSSHTIYKVIKGLMHPRRISLSLTLEQLSKLTSLANERSVTIEQATLYLIDQL